MKFNIAKHVIVDALSKVEKVVGKSSIPILSGIYMSVDTSGLTLVGSDSKDTVKVVVPISDDLDVEKTGATVLEKNVVEIVKKLNGHIAFENSLINHVTTITSGKVEFSLNGSDSEEYPRHHNVDEKILTIKGDKFIDIVKKTAFSASIQETRPILQGIFIEKTDEGCLRFSATDAHRLSRKSIAADWNCSESIQFPVKASTLASMVRVFDSNEDLDIFFSNTQFVVKQANTTYYTLILDGNFPDLTRIIPINYKSKVTMNRREFEQSLEQVLIIAEDKSKSIGKLIVNGSSLVLQAKEVQKGNCKIELAHKELEGEEFEIAFNCKFLLDSLRVSQSTDIEFFFTGSMAPFYIKPIDESDEIYLILPVRTQ